MIRFPLVPTLERGNEDFLLSFLVTAKLKYCTMEKEIHIIDN
jgi:hypothetical protein